MAALSQSSSRRFTSRRQVPARAEKRGAREWALRLLLMVAAIAVAQVGVILFIMPALGTPPFFLFSQGMAQQLGWSLGTTHLMLVVAIMVAELVLFPGYVLPGTFVCSFCAGPFTDFFLRCMDGLVSPASPLAYRFAAMLAGIVVVSIGLALLIRARAGVSSNDLIAIIASEKIPGLRFCWARITCDAVFCTTGFLLGGVLGIGSIASVMLTGPVAQYFFPVMDRLVAAVVRK